MAKNSTENIEALAAEIGQNVYIDVAKWHLYLADAHLHTSLAEQLYPMLGSGSIKKDQVEQVLANISVKLGGGRREVPLTDLLPQHSLAALIDTLEEYQRNL